jgi:hypothetical protein
MQRNHAHLSLIAGLGLVSLPASALDIALSLAPADWVRYASPYQTAAYTITSPGGHLRGTKTTGTGGTSSFLGLESLAAYNFQNATLRYQWLLNGQGSYSAIYTGLRNVLYNFDPNPPSAGYMTTAWSYNGSEVLPSNQWLYTEVAFSETGYDYTVSKLGYGGTDFLHGTKTYGPSTWTALGDAHVFFQLGDNYAAGAYFEVAEVSLTAVPEPRVHVLLLAGLAMLTMMVHGRARTAKAG